MVAIENEAQAAHVAGVGQFADLVTLRRTAGSDAVNNGRGRWRHLRSVGASEDLLFGASAVSLVHLVRQADAVDGLVEGQPAIFACRLGLGLCRLVG